MPMNALVFEVSGQRYALPSADVREVLRAVAVVPLPRAPAVVEGVINLRGRLVPVLDLRTRFRLAAKPVGPTDHFLIAQAGERVVALRVDRATDLVQLGEADVEDAKGVVPGAEYVAWMARHADGLILIHDLRTFLSRAESDALAEALPACATPGQEA
jgi:purine-binding chemotaxis protein CheW